MEKQINQEWLAEKIHAILIEISEIRAILIEIKSCQDELESKLK